MKASVTSLNFRKFSFTRTSLTTSARKAGETLRRQLWIWPIVGAIFLGSLAFMVLRSVEATITHRVSGEIQTLLNADVQALKQWIKHQETNAQMLADAEGLQPLVKELLKELEGTQKRLDVTLWQSKSLEQIRQYLAPRLRVMGYVDFVIVNDKMLVIASGQDLPLGKPMDGTQKDFIKKVLEGKPSLTTPYRSSFLLENEAKELKVGLPTMFAAAPIRESNFPIAALGLRIRPEAEFTKILQIARAGESCETYAFDRQGFFLSQSRFDEDLKRIGLLADLPDAQSVLTLSVRDPEGNLTAGHRPTKERAKQPLTKMAASAAAGNTGHDVEGYRDYRGVPVVGAWTWLPEYDFGVATEIDVEEAYQVLFTLRTVIWCLLGLLCASAAVIYVCMIVVAKQKMAIQKAALEAKQLGQYKLEEKIGAGGMGSVYRARHALLRRPTAIKLLEPDKISEMSIARFEREVQVTAQLQHPNTIAIFDFGRTPEGVFYYVMEYLEGLNLEDLVAKFGPLPEGRVIAILRQICGSLAEAHEQGLVHRDIKPANIYLTRRGGVCDFVKVLDFGLARAVDTEAEAKITSGGMAGTPLYLAPEAIETPDEVDARADIYAVGAVGYFLLTGTPVFKGDSLMDICMKHMKAAPEPPSQRLGSTIHPKLEEVILTCLAKQPLQRPRTSREIVLLLDAIFLEEAWTTLAAEDWWKAFSQSANRTREKLALKAPAETATAPTTDSGATMMFDGKFGS